MPVFVTWMTADAKEDVTMNGLYRPREGRVFAGVCAGLARRYGLGAWTVRLLAIVSCVLPGPQILIYIALWIMMPDERKYAASRP
jgi:phage shock protein PspC (stress-responsive transcriptional regulator)